MGDKSIEKALERAIEQQFIAVEEPEKPASDFYTLWMVAKRARLQEEKDKEIRETLRQIGIDVENAVTNENGEYIIDNVPYGRYVFTEIQAPEGYEIEEGSVGAVFDVKSPETIFEIVNTGDIALVATVYIALISILGITYIVIRNKKQKQI